MLKVCFLLPVIKILTSKLLESITLIDSIQCKITSVANVASLHGIPAHLWPDSGTTVLIIHRKVQSSKVSFHI